MKCQILFSGKSQKSINMASAENFTWSAKHKINVQQQINVCSHKRNFGKHCTPRSDITECLCTLKNSPYSKFSSSFFDSFFVLSFLIAYNFFP